MDRHVIPALLIITGIIALVFVGGGITGMVTGNQEVRNMCAVDSHCAPSQVCCMVDEVGVCGHDGYCAAVVEDLQDEQDVINYVNTAILKENKAALGMVFGMALMLLIVYSFHFVYPRRIDPGDEDDDDDTPPLPQVPEEEEESEEAPATSAVPTRTIIRIKAK